LHIKLGLKRDSQEASDLVMTKKRNPRGLAIPEEKSVLRSLTITGFERGGGSSESEHLRGSLGNVGKYTRKDAEHQDAETG
jgi:hypothetical protein